jgi:hypothetical protein
MLTAIVGILLGNLLIAILFAPALQRLRDILSKFASIELPHDSSWPDERTLNADQRHRLEEKAVDEFNRLFREYEISFKAFQKIGAVFVASIVILACAVVWQLSLTVIARLIVGVTSIAAIVLVGRFLQQAIAPRSSQLVSIDFMQNNFANLHLESFFNCAGLHVNFGRGLASHDPVMHFSIFQKLMFLGYKFFLAVTDDTSKKVYFYSYGSLDSSADFRQYWTPEIKAFEVPLGDFSLADALMNTSALRLHLWLFIPTPRGWVKPKVDHPRFISEEVTSALGGQVGVRLASGNSSWACVDECVDFDRTVRLGRSSWSIAKIDISQVDRPQAVLQHFKREIERCRDVVSRDMPSGFTI